MRKIVSIPVQLIDYATPLPMNKKALVFAVEMKIGKVIFPPVNVERTQNGRYKLNGGRHRLAAHKLLERTEIRALVSKG
jgi:hypothetical protein